MTIPIDVSFRNTAVLPDIRALVRQEAGKLERFGRRLTSCRVAVEQPQRHQRYGNRYRVRLYIGAGLRKPVVVTREPGDSDMHDDLRTVLLGAFRAARRQLQSGAQRVRGDAKPPHEPRALVARLLPGASPEDGYGFIRALDGREIYFHRNSVLHDDFDRLTIGTEVRFEEEEGDEGPQASTVQVVSKPGARMAAGGGRRGRARAPARRRRAG